jgi:hypothetical protein
MENKNTFYQYLSEYVYKFYPKIYEEAVKNAAQRAADNDIPLFSTAPPVPDVEIPDTTGDSKMVDDFIKSWGL